MMIEIETNGDKILVIQDSSTGFVRKKIIYPLRLREQIGLQCEQCCD